MNIKLFAMIMLMVFVAVPVFAQYKKEVKTEENKNEAIMIEANKAEIMSVEKENDGAMNKNEDEGTDQINRDQDDSNEPVLEGKKLRRENQIMNSEKLKNQEAQPLDKGKLLDMGENKKGEAKQIKSRAANEHRSAVANFVHSLLDVADRQGLGGIGKQVREMAMQQNKSEEKVTPMIERIKNKNKIRRFFFGTDFKATQGIKDAMLQTRNRLDKLEKIKDKIIGLEDKTIIGEEIKNLRGSMAKAIKEIKAEENRFSLFGWAKRLFIK